MENALSKSPVHWSGGYQGDFATDMERKHKLISPSVSTWRCPTCGHLRQQAHDRDADLRTLLWGGI